MAIHVRASDGNFMAHLSKTVNNAAAILAKWSVKLLRSDNSSLASRLLTANKKNMNEPPLFRRVYVATDVRTAQASSAFQPLAEKSASLVTIGDFQDEIERLDRELSAYRSSSLQRNSTDWKSEMTRLFDAVDPLLAGDDHSTNSRQLLASRRLPPLRTKLTKKSAADKNSKFSEFTRLWIPLLEQLICSRAYGVVGTKASTFSSYIYRLHTSYWSLDGDDDGDDFFVDGDKRFMLA
jgi:hypothetical protein